MTGVVTFEQEAEGAYVARVGRREVGGVLHLHTNMPGKRWSWRYQGLLGGAGDGLAASKEAAFKALEAAAAADLAEIMPGLAGLVDENARLRRILDPFARAAGFYEIESQADEDAHILVRREDGFASALRVKDFRAAREAVQGRKAA